MCFERGAKSCSSPCYSHVRATLNVCIPYASRDEIAYAVNRCVREKRRNNRHGMNGHADGPQQNGVHEHIDCHSGSDEESCDAISVQDIDSKMMLAHSPPLDILVRTSGVCRLSDFMLWQVSFYVGRNLSESSQAPLKVHSFAASIYSALLAPLWLAGVGADHPRLPANQNEVLA
jgi:hypothetical protein